jgi:hypothetical protein
MGPGGRNSRKTPAARSRSLCHRLTTSRARARLLALPARLSAATALPWRVVVLPVWVVLRALAG